jgi:hypothetical protein
MKNLSAYTIAKNCSDLTDVNAGIEEMNQYFATEKNPKPSAYVRFSKLKDKKQQLEGKTSNLHPIFEQALKPFGIR